MMRRASAIRRGPSQNRTSFVAATVVASLVGVARAMPVLTTLATFTGGNGAKPNGSLTLNSGYLYGTAGSGGANNDGTVFKVPVGGGPVVTIATFTGINGAGPSGSVVVDSSGDLFGTTSETVPGGQTVFEVVANTAAVTTLRAFNGLNGGTPLSGLTADAAGNLYGTTINGGSTDGVTKNGSGIVFKVSAGTDVVSTVFTFSGATAADGGNPSSGITVDPFGNLYGTTIGGGTAASGVVYRIPAGGGPATALASFGSTFPSPSGTLPAPYGNLAVDSAGYLYGTTPGGTGSYGYGGAYRLPVAGGAIAPLAAFNPTAGWDVYGGPILDAAGNLFGTASLGGANGDGVVYELPAVTGLIVTLASFNNTNGRYPYAGLTADAAGNLYGTTSAGGPASDGTVFELTGSGFVVPEPASFLVLVVAAAGSLGRRRCRT